MPKTFFIFTPYFRVWYEEEIKKSELSEKCFETQSNLSSKKRDCVNILLFEDSQQDENTYLLTPQGLKPYHKVIC